MIIRRCVVRVGSQAFLHHGEGQRSEREDADPATLAAAPNACDRRLDPKVTGPCQLAWNESEAPSRETEKGRSRSPFRVRSEFIQRHAGAVRELKGGAVPECNPDRAIGCGLDHLALVNEVAGFDRNTNAAGLRDADRTARRLDLADGRGVRCFAVPDTGGYNTVIPRQIAAAIEHCGLNPLSPLSRVPVLLSPRRSLARRLMPMSTSRPPLAFVSR